MKLFSGTISIRQSLTLKCSEDSVAGITKTWENVILCIHILIEGSEININIWMRLCNGFHALRRSDKTHKTD